MFVERVVFNNKNIDKQIYPTMQTTKILNKFSLQPQWFFQKRRYHQGTYEYPCS